jgi:PPOX class probable F420-dependent enzyme
MERGVALRLVAEARVGRLATVDPGGVPHVVPFVFALEGETAYWAVDQKPKRSPELARLANIRANPNVAFVVDQYEDDWRRLWWVRVDGAARVVTDTEERARALALLMGKYPQYRLDPPRDDVVAVEILRVSSWEAEPDPGAAAGSPGHRRRRLITQPGSRGSP